MQSWRAGGTGYVMVGLLASTALGGVPTLGLAAEPGAAPTFARLAGDPGLTPPRSPATAGLAAEAFRTQEYRVDYGMDQIGAAVAYARGYTGAGTLVAVVDSGLDAGHPEFAGRVSGASRNVEPGSANPRDISDHDDHGTHVAGTIGAARNGRGMHGVAFDSTLLVLRAIGADGDSAPAIDVATAQGARILNGSYGPGYPEPFRPDGSPNPDYFVLTKDLVGPDAFAEHRAVKRAVDAGMLLVFSAGNERVIQPKIAVNPVGTGLFPYIKPENAGNGVYQLVDKALKPVDQSKVDFSDVAGSIITVVAVDGAGKIADFSNLCGVAAAWCIAAPGVDIVSTVPRGTGFGPEAGYGLNSGTSMAAPRVSGSAAVLAQAFPFLTAPQLAQTLFTTATSIGPRHIYGWGLLNLGKAIDGPGAFTSTWDVDTKGFRGRFANDIGGIGGLVKRGAGTLELSGDNTYAGRTTVAGGTLAVDGTLASAVTVEYGGTLRGTGHLGASLTSDGVVRPGNSPGTLTVAGPVTFTAGNLLTLDIDGTGTGSGASNHSRLVAAGPLAAGGLLVPVLRGISGEAGNAYTPALGQRFGVVSAAGGLSGSFSGLVQPQAGAATATRFDTIYGATRLDLVVTPAAFANLSAHGLAQSGNARAVGAAIDGARPAAGTRPDAARAPFFDALHAAAPGTLAGQFESLSGQTYGDALLADLAGRRLLGDTIDRHLTLGGGGASLQAAETGREAGTYVSLRQGPGVQAPPLAVGEGRVWAEGLYGFGDRAGDRAARGTRFDAGGLVAGLDRQVAADALVGAAISYLRKEGDSAGSRLGRFTTDSVGGTLYGSARLDALELRGSAGLGYTQARIDRTAFAASSLRGAPDGFDAGASAFAGYHLGLGLPVALIPEIGVAYDHLSRSRAIEAGSASLFGVRTRDLVAARSLVGGRLAGLTFGETSGVRVEARAYWAHELADTAALIRSDLFGIGFATRTAGVGRDGAVLGLAASGDLAPGARLAASYAGEIRPGATAHAFTAGLTGTW